MNATIHLSFKEIGNSLNNLFQNYTLVADVQYIYQKYVKMTYLHDP